MIKRRKTLPALSPKAPAELRPLFAAMAEILETGEGVRGDKLDRKITLRDLLDSGVAKLRVNNNPGAGIIRPDITIDIPVDMSVPPRPLGFSADGSFFGMIHLSWDLPEDQYDNHSLTNIYRNEQDNFATADIVGREPGMFYSDLVRNDVTSVDDPLNLPGYYYWITFTSKSDVEGPPNSPDGTYAQAIPDAAYILGQISGQLSESALSQALSDRINKIDGPASLGGSVANRLEAEANARAQAISIEVNARTQAMASQNLSLTNSINAERDSRIAAIASGIGSAKDYADAKITIEQQARSDGFGALATQIEQIEAGLGDDYTVGMAIEKQARIDGDSALASNILTLTSYAQGVAADVVSEQQARSSADSALAADITKLYVESGDLKGEVSNEAAARINGDKVLSSVQQVISAANTVGSAALKVSSQVFIDENSAMAIKTEELRVSTSQADALIRSDMLTLAGPDSALANSVTSIRADVDNNSSLITEESTARANAVSAANDKITTLESEVGDSISIINTSLQTLANKDTAMSERLDITEAALGDNTSAIQSEATARADAVTALTNQVNLAQSSVDDSLATIVQNASTQASEITAIAQQVTTVASEVNDSLAIVEEDIRTLVTADSLLAERIDNIQVGSSEEYARIEQIAKVGGETGNRFTTNWWKHNQYAPTQTVTENGVSYELSGPRTIQRGYDYVGPNNVSQTCWFIVAPSNDISTRHGGWTAAFDNVSDERDLVYSVWVRITNSQAGDFFLGLSENYATNLDGSPATNPYFVIKKPPQLHKWFLAIGVLRNSNFSGGSSGLSGLYDPDTGLRVNNGTDYKMKPGATRQIHQTYQFNALQGGQMLLASPRFERLTESTMPSEILSGRVNSKMIENLSAQYTVKLDVNGYVSGFGAYNDGATADFAVLADRFWIASPGSSGQKIHPFMVVGNKVYIDSAFIRDASIQEGKLGPITFGKIFDSTGSPITTIGGKLRVDMIDTNSLRVNTANIVNAAITTAKIGDAQITTAKIGALSVDTLRIAGNAVTVPVTVTGGQSVMPVAGIYLDYAGDIQITGYFVLANRGMDVGSFMEIQERRSGVWTPIKVAGERINYDSTNSAIIVTTVRKQPGEHYFRLWLKRFIPPYDSFSSYSESATITLMGVKR